MTPNETKVNSIGSINTLYIEDGLKQYAETVKLGRPITDETGGLAQRRLNDLFKYVIKLEGGSLVTGMNMLRDYIHENRKTLFSPSYAYRFVHELPGGKEAQNFHVNFIMLLLLKGEKQRERLKQTDIRKLLKGIPHGKQEQLVEYFTRIA